jgi:uncharacterized protein YkwD
VRVALGGRLVLLSLVLAAAAGGPQSRGQADEPRAGRLHREFSYFRAQADGAIDVAAIDHDLLSAAVFHETNRRRAEYSRASLGYRPELQEAARLQARGMARTGAVSHRHPDRRLRTLPDRLAFVGLQAAFAAENTAMTFGIRYTPGAAVYRRTEGGRVLFSYQPDGAPIQPHTYRSFAEALLAQWMRSADHRQNILDESPRELGTGHAHARNEQGMDVFYSVQVFFTEHPPRTRRKR